jgi:hypothetical protein
MFSIEQTITQLSVVVAHDLELELAPADDGLVDEDLRDRRGVQAARGDLRSSSCERAMPPPRPPSVYAGRTMHGSPSRSAPRRPRRGRGDRAGRHLSPARSIASRNRSRSSAGGDRVVVGPDELHPEALERAVLGQRLGEVQRGLAARASAAARRAARAR